MICLCFHITVVRRVIVTEAGSQQVEGIITLRDVFNLIILN